MSNDKWNEKYRAAIEAGDRIANDNPASTVMLALDKLPSMDTNKDLTAIDLGCGEGRHSRELVRRGYKVTGLDFSDVVIEDNKQSPINKDITFIVGDISKLDDIGSFDLILMAYIHLKNPNIENILENVTNHINDNGFIVMVGHSKAQFNTGAGGPAELERLWDYQSISSKLEKLNFDVLHAKDVNRTDYELKSHTETNAPSIDSVIVGRKM